MAYKPIKNEDTATGWGNAEFASPVRAALRHNGEWHLVVDGETIDIPEPQGDLISFDGFLSEDGWNMLKEIRPALYSRLLEA